MLSMAYFVKYTVCARSKSAATWNGIGKQLKYADSQGVPIVVMLGGDEKEKGTVTLKDLRKGRVMSAEIQSRETWIRERPGQIEVPRGELVTAVRSMLAEAKQTPPA